MPPEHCEPPSLKHPLLRITPGYHSVTIGKRQRAVDYSTVINSGRSTDNLIGPSERNEQERLRIAQLRNDMQWETCQGGVLHTEAVVMDGSKIDLWTSREALVRAA
eukprot:CAMPEP_0174333316 /NCGR_PEP_ID=MMETSP0810-20121108/19056_1 /TAXON_ID=73025 ORGANISM="Eutreptiella gymnastica-like, Strain CCMP1594" /NCGR_SAMPLE_ID=MMETSP0810 /ASSEMBLY_ACC=CAM_ASM_000659 /LENGTH=105 /DNA_ID=CAMNT_0015450363 /DNA_START=945 /DNA_END=1262 /DNA_ORIENTATION=-